MTDRRFLLWLRNRLIDQYGESPHVDFVSKLESIISTIHPNKETANIGSSLLLPEERYRGQD